MAVGKILIVDDSVTMHKVIQMALVREGYEIQAAWDGNEAINQLAVFRPQVVLIDATLPGLDAFAVKRAADEQFPLGGPKFVLIASAAERVDEAKVKAAHFHGRLTKPFDPAQLRALLSELLERKDKTGTGIQRPPGMGKNERTGTGIQRPAASTGERTGTGIQRPPQQQAPTLPPRPTSLTPPPSPVPTRGIPAHAPEPPAQFDADPSFDPEWRPDTTGISAPMEMTPEAPRDVPMDPNAEIKKLTESTIRMSGLDDLGWSVDESVAKTPEAAFSPPPPPPQPVAETPPPKAESPRHSAPSFESEPSGFEWKPDQFDLPSFNSDEPSMRPTESHADFGSNNLEERSGLFSGQDFTAQFQVNPNTPHERESASTHALPPTPLFELSGSFAKPAAAPMAPATTHEVIQAPASVPMHEVEAMIAREVERRLGEITRSMLPELAERVIREEIRKLLLEQI
jgi:CheY-like chemotaxis protein